MRDTERDHGMPSEDFLAESVDVWQVWAILKPGRQPISMTESSSA